VILDPKIIVAAAVAVAGLLTMFAMLRHLGKRRARAKAFAPKPMASAPRLLAEYENSKTQVERMGAKTIAIIHDFDNPMHYQSTEREDLSTREAFEVLAAIRAAGEGTPLNIVLHTPGGMRMAAELIATALKDRPNTTAYVPYCAMSAGTMIALSCSKVVMGKHACLGPIDTQIAGFPADGFARLMKEKPVENISDLWLMVSYVVEKDLKNARQRACDLLNKAHFGSDDACRLTDFLASGDMPHSERIGRARAAEIGVNIAKDDCPDAVYRMVETRLELLHAMQAPGLDAELRTGRKAGDLRQSLARST
jgi:hypothetical protein